MFSILIAEKGGDQRRLSFEKNEVTIGRVQGNDVILPKGNVSKRHSRIVLRDGKFVIIDLKSTNGTYVNGRKITGPLVIKVSDRIYVGDFILSLEDGQVVDLDESAEPKGKKHEESALDDLDIDDLDAQPVHPPSKPVEVEDIAELDDLEVLSDIAELADLPNSGGRVEDGLRGRQPMATLPPEAPARPGWSEDAPAPASPASVRFTGPALSQPSDGREAMSPIPSPAMDERASAASPRPDDDCLELQREMWSRLIEDFDLSRAQIGDEEDGLKQRVSVAAKDLAQKLGQTGSEQDELVGNTLAEIFGLGPLTSLVDDGQVTEVLVEAHDRITIEKSGRALATNLAFSSEVALQRVLCRLLAQAGVPVDSSCLYDAYLPGGLRVIAVTPPISRGICIRLCRSRRVEVALADLVQSGMLSPQMADYLAAGVVARRNILITGGHSSGKTTLLGALAALIPTSERIVSVETARELVTRPEHWIGLEAARAGLSEVVEAAVSLHPDRLVIGDIRGKEAFAVVSVLLAKDGALATVAANGAEEALARLVTLAGLASREVSKTTLCEIVENSVHIVVQLSRYGDGERRVASISEVVAGVRASGFGLNEMFAFHLQGPGDDARLRGRFIGTGAVSRFSGQAL